MTVLRDGEHVQTESLNDGTLADWMAFIESDEQCGWDGETNVYSGNTFDKLCDQLAAGVNGGGNR